MLFTLRFIKHLLILLLVSLPLQLIGALVLLCYLPFQDRDLKLDKDIPSQIGLPRVIRYFDNADIWVGRDFSTYLGVWSQGWWAQYCWLAWRNPCNYFGYTVLGLTIKESIVGTWGLQIVGDGNGDAPGYRYDEVLVDNNSYYQYYYIYKWSTTTCFRFRMGWKFSKSNKVGDSIEAVFVVQPYKAYSGN